MLRTMMAILVLCLAANSVVGQSCSDYNWNQTYPWSAYGSVGHTYGTHIVLATLLGDCQYASIGQQNCSSTSQSGYAGLSYLETGRLTNPLVEHAVTVNASGGAAGSNGAQIATQVTAAGTAQSCLKVIGCSVAITFNATVSGIGTTINFPSNNLGFTPQQSLQTVCAVEADPIYVGGGGGCGSPIVIDTTGEGFQFTSAQDGVQFDISGTGSPVQIGWTAKGSRNAFLALDRNHNGKIDSGKELFGNFTSEPPSGDPNGFLALAEFDRPENGGNGDGVIDDKDAVFSKLVLWIDENHDGISQPNEMHTLPEMGVYSLSLQYKPTPRKDQFGNWLRYKGKVNPEGQPSVDLVDRVMYDVFFEILGPDGPLICCNTCGPG